MKLIKLLKLRSNPKKNLYNFLSICAVVLCIVALCAVVICLIYYTINKSSFGFSVGFEKFTVPDTTPENTDTTTYNKSSVISNWDNGSGFFSELAFKLNHYLYCKKYNLNFETPAVNWPYTYSEGWTDYFKEVKLSNKPKDKTEYKTVGYCEILEQFSLADYIAIIPEYYCYNEKTAKHIAKVKTDLELMNIEYGAVYIRRGDKLVDEIKIIPAEDFAKLLLDKMPNCTTIFVQTDDYNCYLDIKKYIETIQISANNTACNTIKVLTICPDTNFGAIANSGYTKRMVNDNISISGENNKVLDDNKKYLENIKHKLSKPIADMSTDERYTHVMELLSGVDICLNAKVVICDYNSNVSRFIKVAHPNFDAIFDINSKNGETIKRTDKLCLGYDFDNNYYQNLAIYKGT